MGGGGSQTTSATYTPGQAALQQKQAEVATAVAPGLQDFLTGVLSGDPNRSSGYSQSAMKPAESSTQRALAGIMARTPGGSMQQQMLEQTRLQGGMQRATTQQDVIKQALQMVGGVFGQQAQPSGQKTEGGGFQPTELIGPGIAAAAVVGAALI